MPVFMQKHSQRPVQRGKIVGFGRVFKMDFYGKTIAIAITGGIAAYKACDLIRELYRRNAHRVLCVMTPTAESFIPPLTLQALSRYPVYSSELSVDHAGVPIHIVLAQQADALVILPATADAIAKLAHGTADNLVTTSAITFTGKPVLVVPAMNTRMWENPLTQENLRKLRRLPHYTVVEPVSGHLACGETGDGHLAEQETILQSIYRAVHSNAGMYQGVRAVITAGGTSEPIDPVALADELSAMGADVTLITTRPPASRLYSVVPVQTAFEMREAVNERFEQADVVFMAAAVSDYSMAEPSLDKIKRESLPDLTLKMVSNPDILAELGQRKQPGQLLIGFAAESSDLIRNASEKMRRKNLDAIVANDISRADIGFEADENEVTLLFPELNPQILARARKELIARSLLLLIYDKLLAVKTKLTLVKSEVKPENSLR
jgi:phosphopantothenoylcysteine decarboxylase / phosphopantothenate---cysteine ligase